MSSIPMHASCQGNRSGEAFLKDPVKHLECAWIFFLSAERAREIRGWNICPYVFTSIISHCDMGKSALSFTLKVLLL